MKLLSLLHPPRTDASEQGTTWFLAELRREWDRRRSAADTQAERGEIDAVYSRVVP